MTSTNAGVWGAVGDEIEVPYEGCVKVWSSGLNGGEGVNKSQFS